MDWTNRKSLWNKLLFIGQVWSSNSLSSPLQLVAPSPYGEGGCRVGPLPLLEARPRQSQSSENLMNGEDPFSDAVP